MVQIMEQVVDWLLDSDPSIRWQVKRDLTRASSAEVRRERARVAGEGWGASLLALQGEDGMWGGGVYSPKWVSTTYTLLLLRHLGVDPGDERVRAAVGSVRDQTVWRNGKPYFDYATEMCVTGMVLALGSYFLTDVSGMPQIDHILERQRSDGGWNCEVRSDRSSFNTTISVLEALLEHERAMGGDVNLARARALAHEYLLERKLMYSLSSGELINKRWLLMSFPPRWFYDVLRALDYFREAGAAADPRVEEAIAVVESKRLSDGSWPLQNRHPGKEHFPMEEGAGKPSRWNTLRVLRVLDWYRSS